MPELPEVETVARDLRRHLLPGDDAAGPVITGARVGWQRTLRDEDPARFVAGVTGRRIEAVGRRGKQLVIDLDGGAFLDRPPQDDRPAVRRARVPAASTRTSASRWRSTTAASCASATSASSGGSACTAPTTTRSTASGRSRWTPRFTAARVPQAHPRAARAPQAAPRGPGVHRRHRQHLRRRGAVAVEAPPAALRAVAAPGRRAAPVPEHRRDPRRGRRAARARRSTTTRPPTATARCRSASTCTSARASHAGAAGARSGGS